MRRTGTNRTFAALAVAGLLALAFTGLPTQASAQDARVKEVLNKLDDLYRSGSAKGTMSMRVKTEHYERSMKMESWSKGTDKSLVRILEPLKEKGTATLKSGKNIYTYLPKTDRTIRLTSGMMSGSWMGSHFTNDDLVQDSRMSEDYKASISKESKESIEITLKAREDAAVAWDKIVISVRVADSLPQEYIFFDEDGVAVRTMTFSNYKQIGGRTIPAKMRVVPKDSPGEYTEVVYEEMAFDVSIEDSMFSKGRLKR